MAALAQQYSNHWRPGRDRHLCVRALLARSKQFQG
jgi:hypothetical protein